MKSGWIRSTPALIAILPRHVRYLQEPFLLVQIPGYGLGEVQTIIGHELKEAQLKGATILAVEHPLALSRPDSWKAITDAVGASGSATPFGSDREYFLGHPILGLRTLAQLPR